MDYTGMTFNTEQEQELKHLFDSLDNIQIFSEITNILTADEYDELNNLKWESYEVQEEIGVFSSKATLVDQTT
jgi:tRNA (Thr-GGU) A37 N-methylase